MMTPQAPAKGRWSLALRGTLAQFNISILIILAALIWIFVVSLTTQDPIFHYGGSAAALTLIAVCVYAALRRYNREESRPSNGRNTLLQIQNQEGQKIILQNPPDSFFAREQTHQLLRAVILGYDENLCPDGKVIGDVAKEQYQPCSQQEQKQFMREHRYQIRGRKQQAKNLLLAEEASSATETDSQKGEPKA